MIARQGALAEDVDLTCPVRRGERLQLEVLETGKRAAADAHRHAGLAAVTGEHYEGGHWLGSFAVYLTTQRGSELHPSQETNEEKQ